MSEKAVVQPTGGELLERDYIRIVFHKGIPGNVGINGCRIEDLLDIAIERLERYQMQALACVENERAIQHLQTAKAALLERVERRKEQGVFHTLSQHVSTRTEDEVHDFSATGA